MSNSLEVGQVLYLQRDLNFRIVYLIVIAYTIMYYNIIIHINNSDNKAVIRLSEETYWYEPEHVIYYNNELLTK